MSFAEASERLQAAVFARLGEDADWQGVAEPVRVIRREYDEDDRLGRGSIVETVRFIRVRRSDVEQPEEGQTVQILDAAGAAIPDALYRVSGEPTLDRKGVWRCPVDLAD